VNHSIADRAAAIAAIADVTRALAARFLLALAGPALLFIAAWQPAAAEPCKVNGLEIPVTISPHHRAVAHIGLNGVDTPLIVDSGAFFSFLTPAAAQQLQLKLHSLPWGMTIEGLTGDVEANLATVKRVTLQGGDIPDVEFVIGGNDESGTKGLLGRNFLAIADVEYDLAHGMIRLMFPTGDCEDMAMAYWAGDQPFSELRLSRDLRGSRLPAITAVVAINGHKLRALFDTGAESMVSLSGAKEAGITDLEPDGEIYGAGRDKAKAWHARVDTFEVAGEKVSHIRLPVGDFQMRDDTQMLLGIDFFLSHRIYVSKRQRKMYFTYNGGPIFTLSAVDMAKAAAASPPAASAASAQAAASDAAADPDEPTTAAGFARRGGAELARLDFARALADLDRACAMEPQTSAYFAQRGVVHQALKQPQLALDDFDRALQLDPTQTDARLRRAWMRSAAHDKAALQADVDALDHDLPPQAHERLQLAQLYQKLDQPERAIAQWSLWVPAHPNDIQLDHVLNSRCWARVLLNVDLDKALEDCDQAVDLQSKNSSYRDSRGWLHLRRGELDDALDDFNRALKLDPDYAWSLYGRGLVRLRTGHNATSQADLDAARKRQPNIDAQARREGLVTEPLPTAAAPAASAAPAGS